jgi:hypothetical protein
MSLHVLKSYGSVARGDDEEAVRTYRRFQRFDDKDEFVEDYGAPRFFAIIIAYTHLRESTQREEALSKIIEGQRKQMAIDDTNESAKAELEQLEHEIKGLRRRIWSQEQTLYRAEWTLWGDLRTKYYAVRKHPKWFLCPELVEDCVSRGGCCARECGCCEKRASSPQRKKGHGHCTVECGCCIRNRGIELTEEEKEQTRHDFENLLWDRDAAYAVHMVMGYFWDVMTYEDEEPKESESKPEDTEPNPEDTNSKPEDVGSEQEAKASKDTKSNPPASSSSTSKDPPPPYTTSGDTVANLTQKQPASKLQKALQRVSEWL